MKISNLSPMSPASSGVGRSDSARSEVAKSAERKPVAPEIQSSGVAEALTEANDVDLNKVSEIRQAIREGKLSLDPDVLAEAVLGMYRR